MTTSDVTGVNSAPTTTSSTDAHQFAEAIEKAFTAVIDGIKVAGAHPPVHNFASPNPHLSALLAEARAPHAELQNPDLSAFLAAAR